MTYEELIAEACEAIGGSSFGGKFVSRQQIKKWLAENKDIDCDLGVSKKALKRALLNFDRKGDSYRLSKEMRAKKAAAAKAAAQKEKAREKKEKLAAEKAEKAGSPKSTTPSKKTTKSIPKTPSRGAGKTTITKPGSVKKTPVKAKGQKVAVAEKAEKSVPVKKQNAKRPRGYNLRTTS